MSSTGRPSTVTSCVSGSSRTGPGLERARRGRRATQERAQPRQQLLDRERLREVVVRAGVEAEHAVAEAVERRQHQDRQVVALSPGLAADREAVAVGQAQVEDDRGRLIARERGQRLVAAADADDVVAGLRELDLEHAGDRLVVLDDEDALTGGGHVPQ